MSERHRILEHHRDLLAADIAQLVVVEAGELAGRGRSTEPVILALGARVSPVIVCAVTLLPQPDSPTMASTSPAREVERHPVDRLYDAVFGGEADLEVVDREDGAHAGAASPSRIRGSSTA